MDEQWRAQAHELLQVQAAKISAETGSKIKLHIAKGYPFLKNDPALSARVEEILIDTLGVNNVKSLDLRMTAEDFAFYSQEKPVCFFRLGVGNQEKGIVHAVHHPRFDIDEQALEIGVKCMVQIALA
jgi:hippurate hydrolase